MDSGSNSDGSDKEIPEVLSERGSDEDDFIQFGTLDVSEFNYRVDMGATNCTCVSPIDWESCLGILSSIFIDSLYNRINCVMNSVVNCCNYALEEFTELEDPKRLAFADEFYKTRHELLFKMTLRALNLPETASDKSFKDFGFNSNRTPDYIQLNNDGSYTVIEVGSTSNFEKTAMLKGLQSHGYESKYKPEIDEIRSYGNIVDYVLIIYDMTSYNQDYHSNLLRSLDNFNINEMELSFLNYCYKEYCTITYNMKNYLSSASTILFTGLNNIEEDHSNIKFCYSNEELITNIKYKSMTVSNQVYNKVTNTWSRLSLILEKCFFKDTDKIIPVISINNNKLYFDLDSSGLVLSELNDVILRNDKFVFLKILKLKSGNTFFNAEGSESGFKFTDKIIIGNNNTKINHYNRIPNLNNHFSFQVKKYYVKLNKYSSIIASNKNKSFRSIYYNENYEDYLLESMSKFDEISGSVSGSYDITNVKVPLIANNDMDKVDITEKMNDLFSKWKGLNNATEADLPVKIIRMKPSFLLPIADISRSSYSSLSHKNNDFYSYLINNLSHNEYTKLIITKILDNDFSFKSKSVQPSQHYIKLKDEKYELSNKMSYLYRKWTKNMSIEEKRKNKKLKDCTILDIKSEYDEIRVKISNKDKELRTLCEKEGIKQEISMLRLPTKGKKSFLSELYRNEMQHFRDKNHNFQSTIEGVGNCNIESNSFFRNMSQIFSEYRGENPDLLIDCNSYEDSNLLKELKEKSIGLYSNLISDVKNSFLGHSSAFVSRFSHSLLYYSQMPFNSDFIRVDNLGYKDCLLIVKGGKKIFKTKSSKMFRLIYPINDYVMNHFVDESIGPSNFQIVNYNGVNYMITPWSLLHESILTDSLSFYPRVCSFAILNLNPEAEFYIQIDKIILNLTLAYHNRRQTEVFLANLRYILMSTMGEFSGMFEIFEEFLGFNYDKFQFILRDLLLNNYKEYFIKMRTLQKENNPTESRMEQLDIRNIFSRTKISKSEDLTLMIYSTFLMTKGPYQRSIERAINLKGILKIHELYDECVGLDLSPFEQMEKISVSIINKDNEVKNYGKYCEELFSNDFNIDPYYISCMGYFANCYYEELDLKDKFYTEWNKILNKEWDSLSTSTGLRGDPSQKEDFWGRKGYFVVYKFLLNEPGYQEKIDSLFNLNLRDSDKLKLLSDLNQNYLSKISLINKNKEKDYNLLFHAVDKVQWRGSREIYVMDLNTKIMQQPIEKFMTFLCKNVDNELISIPTDKRAQLVHHNIFEKDLPLKDVLTYFLTLDCTKWAPKSVFIKFAIMLTSMPIIPPSFVNHFLNYLSKLYYKRIYFNVAEVEVLAKNSKFKEQVDKYLTYDDYLNAYFLIMPYSWVMGIFNYTSSFMHAFNQKYSSYLINKSSMKNFGEETNMVMFAHSDDSGGRISSTDKSLIKRGLFYYEVNLKCCNHLLSKKKSVVSKSYFEILSIIYFFKKLMALLPKFLGGLRFNPTDKGPCNDMLQSYSKCVEVIIAGSDFTIAYLVMKIFSAMVWRFYYNSNITSNEYKRPVQLFGLPDSHPLMVLLVGSDCDLLRLICNDKIENFRFIHLLNTFMCDINDDLDDTGIIKSLKFNIKVRNIHKGFEEPLDFLREHLENWTVGNVVLKKSPFNALNFLKKLRDPGFIGSLVDESLVRRISRSYYIRKGESVILKKGLYKLEGIISSLRLMTDISFDPEYNIAAKEILRLCSPDFQSDVDRIMKMSSNELSETTLYKITNNLLSGPLKLNKYFNKLTLKDKEVISVNRTLKPTQVQLLKIGSSFTKKFEPSQLVSYIREEQFRWALPDLKNLETSSLELNKLLNSLTLNIEDIDNSSLLKIIRLHTSKVLKDIYVYSQIPGEARQIKTYSTMLLFLSTNSFKNKEIKGLSLKLKNILSEPGYVQMDINEDIYLLNNICAIIIMMFGIEDKNIDFSEVFINPIQSINWVGGEMDSFVNFINDKSYTIPDFQYISLYSKYIENIMRGASEVNGNILINTCFYTFLKEQKLRSGWYGSGILMIYVRNKFFIYHILGDKIIKVESNHSGKIDRTDLLFINDTFVSCGIKHNFSSFRNQEKIETEMCYGFNHLNELSISVKREIDSGVDFVFVKRPPSILNKLDFSVIKYMRENLFILNISLEQSFSTYKIYGLKLNKYDLINNLKEMFCLEGLNKAAMLRGENDSFNFIKNEILINLNEEMYMRKDDFLEQIFATETYRVFKYFSDNDKKEAFPNKLKTSTIPAQEGTFIRLLIDYGSGTGKECIKSYKNYNPLMMSLRSEFPENFSLILSENLIKSHKDIYDMKEVEEIKNSFHKLSMCEDLQSVKKEIIDLMCYWGYGSLFNTISLYDYKKKKENYFIAKYTREPDSSDSYIAKLFKDLIKIILKTLIEFANCYESLDFSIKGFCENRSTLKIISNYMKYIACTPFGYKFTLNLLDISNIQFIIMLQSYIKIPEFCDRLQYNFSENTILNTIPVDYNNFKEFMLFLNTTKSIFFKNLNFKNVNIDFTKLIQRDLEILPFNVIEDFKILNSKEMVYFHGFLSKYLMDKMRSLLKIEVGEKIYNVNQVISKLSDTKVTINKFLQFKRPLNEEFLESEEWEELREEMGFADPDEDTINELIENIDSDIYIKKEIHYKKSKGKGRKKVVNLTMHWLIYPYIEGYASILNNLRQVGENCVLLTTCLLDTTNIFNSHSFFINLSEIGNSTLPDCFAYCFGNEELNESFWKEMFGENKIKISTRQFDGLFLKGLNTDFGVSVIGLTGAIGTDKLLTVNYADIKNEIEEMKKKSDEIAITKDKMITETEKDSDGKSFRDKVDDLISESLNKGYIKKSNEKSLRSKFYKHNPINIKSLEDLLDSLKEEINLIKMSTFFDEVISKDLTKDQTVKINQSPIYFSMIRASNNDQRNPLLNPKIVADIDSLCKGISRLLASGTLTISKSKNLLFKRNYRLWSTYIKGTDYFKQNKIFLMQLINSIYNSAFEVKTDEDDNVWDEFIQNCTFLITKELEDESEESSGDEIQKFDYSISDTANAGYRFSGFD